MKKFILVFITSLILISGVYLGLKNFLKPGGQESNQVFLPEEAQFYEFSNSNNSFRMPSREDLVHSDKGYYIKNEILLDVNLDEFDESTLDKYGAEIIGRCDYWGGYQLRIPGADLFELEEVVEGLKGEKGVLICQVHWYIPVSDLGYDYPDDDFYFWDSEDFFSNSYNKDKLWEDYDIDEGIEGKLINLKEKKFINKIFSKYKFGDNPYWGYQATNLPYMWRELGYFDPVKIAIMDSYYVSTNIEDLDCNLIDDSDMDPEYRLKMEEYVDTYEKNLNKNHPTQVASLALAKHNNYGFSGTCINGKAFSMIYTYGLEPYIIAYTIDKNENSKEPVNIFNISMGKYIEDLCAINASEEQMIEILKVKKIKKTFNNKKISLDELKNMKEYYESYVKRINMALKSLIENDKDFLIIKASGNFESEIQTIEKNSSIRINITSEFDKVDQEVRDRVIIVGASSPIFDVNVNGDQTEILNYCADFSIRKNVDVYAPGLRMPGYSRKGKAGSWQGTSASAPFVSGIAANIYGYLGDTSGDEVKQLIVNSGTIKVKDKNNLYSAKLIDAKKIIDEIKNKRLDQLKNENYDETLYDKEGRKISYKERYDSSRFEMDKEDFIKYVLKDEKNANLINEKNIFLVKKRRDESFYVVTSEDDHDGDYKNIRIYVANFEEKNSSYILEEYKSYTRPEYYVNDLDAYIFYFYDPDIDKYTDYLYVYINQDQNSIEPVKAFFALENGKIYDIPELKAYSYSLDIVYRHDYPQGVLQAFKLKFEPRDYIEYNLVHKFNNFDNNFKVIEDNLDDKKVNLMGTEEAKEKIMGIWRDIENSYSEYDPLLNATINVEARVKISEDYISFYYKDSEIIEEGPINKIEYRPDENKIYINAFTNYVLFDVENPYDIELEEYEMILDVDSEYGIVTIGSNSLFSVEILEDNKIKIYNELENIEISSYEFLYGLDEGYEY